MLAVVAAGLGEMGGAQPLAVTMNDGVALVVEVDEWRAMYEQSIGLVLPRRANEQAAATQTIDRTDLKPGDLVFFNTMRRAFSHVGIYVGDGKFIHAPRSGAQVRVEDMREAYWQTRFNGARRVAGGNSPSQ